MYQSTGHNVQKRLHPVNFCNSQLNEECTEYTRCNSAEGKIIWAVRHFTLQRNIIIIVLQMGCPPGGSVNTLQVTYTTK
jgi:hypothetical protein